MASELTLSQMREKLEEMFIFTSDLALGKNSDFVKDARAEAAKAAAEIAHAIVEIEEFLREGEPARELRKFRVEVFVGNTQKFEEIVWAESRESAESHVNRMYARAGTVGITSIEEVE